MIINPTIMIFSGWIALAGIAFFSCREDEKAQPVKTPPQRQSPVDKNWSFKSIPVWADEFDYEGAPDPVRWGYDIGGHGWGNNELQYYTQQTKNARVEDGKLIITAVKETQGDKDYSSARVITKHKGDFLYGRFEIRAKLPSGKGTWPAIWMLPTDWSYGDWPKSGEIDIMEHVGFDQDRIHITVHTEAYNHSIGTQVGKNKVIPGVSTDFHRYRVDWTPYAVRGYIDDEQIFEFINQGTGSRVWPFDKRFHLLLNIAVGGNWGGQQGVDPGIFPQRMEVDYVRVYEMIEKE